MMRPKIHLALDWAVRCFGSRHVYSTNVRALRLVEEAIEAAQAAGVPESQVLAAVGIVYQRKVGELYQEVGGVMLTAAVLMGIRGLDIDELFDMELRRVLSQPIDHFAQRNKEKNALGLSGE